MSNENNNMMYVDAARRKLRFESGKGQLSVEDLWDLSLESLDRVAIALDEKVQKAGRKSFIGKRDTQSTEETLRLDIVKHVIETKMTEADAAKTRAAKTQQKQFLKGLLEKKTMEQLEGLSAEEIQKQIDALD